MSELHVRVVDGEPAVGQMLAAAPAKNGDFSFTSPAMQMIERLIGRVAPTESTVLITGESGTGKGVSARRIHELSSRRDGPFLAVNCGAIPETLIESELFGHAKGAFTGAHHGRKGLFLQAERGTLFLDEIGEAPLSMQTKLLHALEAREVRALGSEQSRRIDVRIIAATNCDLPALVAQGRFRQDLLFRLSMFQLAMPPLRKRRSDLPGLIRHLIAQRDSASGTAQPLTIDPDAEDLLVSFDWPGNVRQLENVLHRAAILADGGCIRTADLPPEVLGAGPAAAGALACDDGESTLRERVRRFELSLIRRAIDDAGGERRLAAQRLGIGLSSLYRKLGDSPAAVRML
jgi:two-component system response regulator AtoC